jgi:2-methylaconitate cis-trans-isomerase PrpF
MAVTGGCCLAAAALIPGSVAHRVAPDLPAVGADFAEFAVDIENPAGILQATVVARAAGNALEVRSAADRRSAQVLLRGHVPLYRASASLRAALLESIDGTEPALDGPLAIPVADRSIAAS